MERTFQELLHAYRSLWKSRELSADGEDAEVTLKKAILMQLKDELTHPRVRKSPEVKYIVASERIVISDLEDTVKIALISLHLQLLKTLDQGGKI
ncbi:hypothetical protein GJU40_12265 [Bacillus lacus]|uniref:Uncharacterized protein n=1 Tax=Metabacillus lacus TaxID=1983721 RepID=A0A7X2IZZ8_9BACI|nr:hypothetical protein [Metabacillus lacus]MRX72915.1 hypothetical protein [Metabacillus lacus]